MLSLINQAQDHPAHQRRVLIEYLELQEKQRNLRTFLGNDQIDTLEALDQNLLYEQYRVMGMYLSILENRIERFTT